MNALYTAALSLNQPFNFVIKQMKKCGFSAEDAHDLFTCAHWLLNDHRRIQHFVEQLRARLTTHVQFINKQSITKITHPLQVLPKLTLRYPSASASPYNQVKWDTVSVELLPASTAGQLLGINPNDLISLSINNMLSRKIGNRISYYSLDDLDTFFGMLLLQSGDIPADLESDFMSLSSLTQLSERYLFDFGQSLALIQNEKIQCYKASNPSSLNDIFVDTIQFKQLLNRNEKNQICRPLSVSELKQYFCAQDAVVHWIALRFNWKKFRPART